MPLNSSTAINLGGVMCWDEETSERFGRQTSQATRSIRCKWEDRVRLAGYLIGATTYNNGTTQYNSPQGYPDMPWLYVQEVDIEGADGDTGRTTGANGLIAYKYALLKATYRQAEFDSNGVEYGEESLDFSSDSELLSATTPCFKWGDTGDTLDVLGQPKKKFNIIHFNRVVKSLAVLPTVAIMALQDKINATAFLGAPAKQLLFRGAKSFRRFALDGHNQWDVSYCMSYRSIPWDQHYRAGGGSDGWHTVTYTNGDPLYATGNFSTLGFTS